MPVKVYDVTLTAGTPYLLEVTPQAGSLGHHVRVEDADGHVLTEGQDDPTNRRSRAILVAPAADSCRLIVRAVYPVVGAFTLKVREMAAGETLPEPERLMPPLQAPDVFKVAARTSPFLSAAIAPDCKSAWVAFPKGELQRFSCPDFAVTDRYQLPRQAYQLAISGRGLLCAVVPRVDPVRPALPWHNLGPADIHLYDTTTLAAGDKDLTPKYVVSGDGVIEHLLVSPDDDWLYFLDTRHHKVGRVNLSSGQLDGENADIDTATKAMCLTPDGKALYTCSDKNVVQRLDPTTLHVDKTIRIEACAPCGIQATNDGDLFLNGGDLSWTFIYLVNANRDYGAEVAKVVAWANVYHQNSILLSPDQTRLYSCCFSLSPAHIKAYRVPPQPALYRAIECGAIQASGPARGTLAISRDGKFLFSDGGQILTLGR